MTATPIPRTMALLRYGDLDITDAARAAEGPPADHDASVASTDGERAARLRAHPRASSTRAARRSSSARSSRSPRLLAARAATAEYERLRGGELADYRVALLHGQMRPSEKQEAMAAFAAGGADVLVATTVIEVGVDVPNATVMLVEGAERFGISQLHQLRGRIGRGEHRLDVPAVRAQAVGAAARAAALQRRLRARADRPRAARRGRDRRHAPVGPRAVSLRAAARRRGARRGRARLRRAAARGRPRAARARARAARRRARGRVRRGAAPAAAGVTRCTPRARRPPGRR